jgi:triacylglycerol lipase
MGGMKRHVLIAMLAVVAMQTAFGLEPELKGYPNVDFRDFGFPITLPELALALALNRSVALESVVEIRARWSSTFSRIDVVELASVENRYILFSDDADKRQYVAIRGTANLKNAMYDVQLFRERSPVLGIDVHKGFNKVARAVYADLRPRLEPGYKFHIGGHSLGAAEALLVGMMLATEGLSVERIVASGVPKVTDAAGWSKFSSLPVVRVVAPFDPVPFLPPRNLVYDEKPYTQGGTLLMLLDGRYFTVLRPEFYDSLSVSMRDIKSSGKHFDVPDHLVKNYVTRLEAKVNGVELVDEIGWMLYAQPLTPAKKPGSQTATPALTATLPLLNASSSLSR